MVLIWRNNHGLLHYSRDLVLLSSCIGIGVIYTFPEFFFCGKLMAHFSLLVNVEFFYDVVPFALVISFLIYRGCDMEF